MKDKKKIRKVIQPTDLKGNPIGGMHVYEGDSEEEVMDKMLYAIACGTRKIRELSEEKKKMAAFITAPPPSGDKELEKVVEYFDKRFDRLENKGRKYPSAETLRLFADVLFLDYQCKCPSHPNRSVAPLLVDSNGNFIAGENDHEDGNSSHNGRPNMWRICDECHDNKTNNKEGWRWWEPAFKVFQQFCNLRDPKHKQGNLLF